jgi:DNA-binding SARP family transcriptional activator
MGTVHVQLLGGFSLHDGDQLVSTVKAPRLQSLLAYLVLHSEAPCSRKHLAFLMWPDSTEEQAQTNLRKQLYELRHALPDPNLLVFDHNLTIQWNPHASFTFDVAEFECQVAKARSVDELRQAVELYRGDLLPGCYEEWIIQERERLRQEFVGALERLTALLEIERDYPTAIEYALRLKQHDPLRESPYRLLMRLHALNGDRAAAIHTYHSCAATLQRELGVEPGAATR